MTAMAEIFDITQTLREGMAVWPGDPEFHQRRVARIQDGDASNLSVVDFGVHNGTHLDAPLHVDDAGSDTESIPMQQLMGKARVIELAVKKCIRASDLSPKDWQGVKRVLFKTSAPNPSNAAFDPGFIALHEDAAAFLVEMGMVLVGIDAPSVDAWQSEDLAAHRILLSHKIAVLEGLRLEMVPPGDYELICLPLKILGADGVPVRAILRT